MERRWIAKGGGITAVPRERSPRFRYVGIAVARRCQRSVGVQSVQCQVYPNLGHHYRSLLQVTFGIHLRDICGRVPQRNLCSLQIQIACRSPSRHYAAAGWDATYAPHATAWPGCGDEPCRRRKGPWESSATRHSSQTPTHKRDGWPASNCLSYSGHQPTTEGHPCDSYLGDCRRRWVFGAARGSWPAAFAPFRGAKTNAVLSLRR